MTRLPVALAVLIVLSVLPSPAFAQDDYASMIRIFDYDLTEPLDVQVARTDTIGEYNVAVQHVDFVSPVAGRVTALLVLPLDAVAGRPAGGTSRRYAGVVFLHWGQGDKSEFVWEAALYARAGAISVLVDAPWARPEPWTQPGESYMNPELSKQMYVQNIKDLRRSVDLLLERGDVDPGRLAYVGHSFGATQGGVFAGVERRVKTFVLIAGLPSLVDFTATGAPKLEELNKAIQQVLSGEQLDNYVATISPLTPANFIGHASPASILMQFGTYDSWIPRASAERYFAAAAEPKQVKWYLTSHEFIDLPALMDRANWLRKEVGIRPVAGDLKNYLRQ